ASVGAGAVSLIAFSGTPAPAASQAPTIEIQAPPGTQVLLNGEAVGKTVSVEPDRAHQLQVDLKGHESWTTSVRLGLGETRVFVVMPVDLPAN
ncbi:MAG: PEGA domain-containing protein, partial [Myxococcota bacterium]